MVPPVWAGAGEAGRTVRAAALAAGVAVGNRGAAGWEAAGWGPVGWAAAGWAAADSAQSEGSRQAAASRTRLMRIKRLPPPLKRYCQERAATARIGWHFGL